ncbi:MAG: alanine racemase [Azonexus sp.]|jgi:alanine racemase|nr:alanine racemase [Azonexus sp.]
MSGFSALSRPLRVRIAPAAIGANYRLAKRLAPTARAWAVIKADAYGHGQWRAVDALSDEADGFALLECENAVALREKGVRQPILLLEGIFSPADVDAVREYRLTPVAHSPEQLEWLIAGCRDEQPLDLYLKLNTGMNRLGFTAENLPRMHALLARLPSARVTLMTHFAEADGERGVDWQLARFREMAAIISPRQSPSPLVGEGLGRGGERLDASSPSPPAPLPSRERGALPTSLANSAAILRYPATHGDWVRPGIMLYGASPFADESAAALGLRPAMTLESRIIAVQEIEAGERVGYGGAFTAPRRMRIGVVACGYADGYPRHAPNGTPLAVAGQRSGVVGRVSMDMLACDLTHIPAAVPGSPVTLWGVGAGGVVAADEVAAAAGTIAYELFCAVAPRVPVVVEEG